MARLYQDYEFTVTEVAGRSLIELLGVVDESDSDFAPTLVYARLDSPVELHRFFLSISAAFWETEDLATAKENFANIISDGYRIVDYSPHIGGLPQQICSAVAYQEGEMTLLRIILSSRGEVTLIPDSPEFDPTFHISFK